MTIDEHTKEIIYSDQYKFSKELYNRAEEIIHNQGDYARYSKIITSISAVLTGFVAYAAYKYNAPINYLISLGFGCISIASSKIPHKTKKKIAQARESKDLLEKEILKKDKKENLDNIGEMSSKVFKAYYLLSD